ncbi:MAG TPA: hypothetical protein VFK02_28435 [Kofleriaceae bacterium]|nr:hypothetical protein [Kofleriaceae bacterium]
MSGQPARSSEPAAPHLMVLGGEAPHEVPHEVFDVLGVSDNIIRVRTAFLFEVGEELRVRIEQDGQTTDATARVRGHVGPDDARITELEISNRTASAPATATSTPPTAGGPAAGR